MHRKDRTIRKKSVINHIFCAFGASLASGRAFLWQKSVDSHNFCASWAFLRHSAVDVYLSAAKARLREVASFRADFLAGTVAVIAQQIIVLVFLSIMFGHSQTIGNYDIYQTLLLFGLAMSVQSLGHIFFEGIHILGPRHVERGEFDLMLIRPGHPLLHVLSGYFQISGILPFFIGSGVAIYALFRTSNVYFPLALLLLPVFMLSGTLILGGILLATSSMAFRFKRVRTIRRTIQSLEATMVYPLEIFPKGFQFLLYSLLPFGWAAFGPSRFFLTGDPIWMVASLIAGPLVLLAGIFLFNYFAKFYESTGT